VVVTKEGLGDFMEDWLQIKVLNSIEQLSFEAILV
jgi:hypothetical protein